MWLKGCDNMSLNVPWDKYEAVILLDALIKTYEGALSKETAIKKVSDELRQIAVNKGINIDDAYRNENGIRYQMRSMESAYYGTTSSIPATQLFIKIVSIYNTDSAQFEKILSEAKGMTTLNKNDEADFASWLASKISTGQIQELTTALHEVELLARKMHIIQDSIYKEINPFKVKQIRIQTEQNKIFKFTHKVQWKSIIMALKYLQQYAEEKASTSSKVSQNVSTVSTGNMVHKATNKKDALEEFSLWLRTQGLSDSTSKGYTKAILQAEKYAESHSHINCALVTDNSSLCIATVDELFSSKEFIIYNLNQHNYPRAAITKLLEFYGLTYNFRRYVKNKSDSSKVTRHDDATEIDQPYYENLRNILMSKYKYGFKYNSLREIMRFRQMADEMGITIPEDENELKSAIISLGILIDDKVYCKNENLPTELQQIVNRCFNSGASIIYYKCLYEHEQEWMDSNTITSPEMLKIYLQNYLNGCSFSKQFMAKGDKCTEKEAVTKEVKRVWGERLTETVDNLNNRLPYIPFNNIFRTISGNDHFTLVSEGEYLLVERLSITKDTEDAILCYVDEMYNKNGFVSLNDIPLKSIEEENPDLPKFAICNAIYKKVLRDKYSLNGKILIKGQNELDAIILLKQYISDKDECTFDEVADKVVELIGSANRQYTFQALYDKMIRVDQNRFVSDKSVDFHIDEIDDVLSGFVTNGFLAIKDIATFVMFPLCGQSWNHYLLESFCYKYSRKFTLCVNSFNDKNVGIISERDNIKKYDDMLAIAVARSSVNLSLDDVGKYLFENGYMAKSKFVKLNEIINTASELRKERN